MVVLGVLFVIAYTIIGGFLAETASDFMQALVMVSALGAVLVVGIAATGGVGAVISNAREIPGFLEFFGIAQPQVVDGIQQLSAAIS